MKNIQVKFFHDGDALNGWLKTFQGEVLDIKLQSEIAKKHFTDKDELLATWAHFFMVIFQQ